MVGSCVPFEEGVERPSGVTVVGVGVVTFFPPAGPMKSGIADRTRERTSVFFPLAIVDCLRPFFLSSSSLVYKSEVGVDIGIPKPVYGCR